MATFRKAYKDPLSYTLQGDHGLRKLPVPYPVVTHTPSYNEYVVPEEIAISIEFAEEMNLLTLTNQSVKLYDLFDLTFGAPTEIPLSIVYHSGLKILEVEPTGTYLFKETRYQVRVDLTVLTLSGTPLDFPHIWTFRGYSR